MNTAELKAKGNITRADIAALLKSLGKPRENREEKLAAIQELGLSNTQGHALELTLESYNEY